MARLERESYGKVNLQTLIDIATKLDIALIVRFVSFPTFLEWTNDYSGKALAPNLIPKKWSGSPLRSSLSGLPRALTVQHSYLVSALEGNSLKSFLPRGKSYEYLHGLE